MHSLACGPQVVVKVFMHNGNLVSEAFYNGHWRISCICNADMCARAVDPFDMQNDDVNLHCPSCSVLCTWNWNNIINASITPCLEDEK